MVNIRKFKISDATFQGFEVDVDLDFYESKLEICKQVRQSLVAFLQSHHFDVLARKAVPLRFHIHDMEFGTILLSEPNVHFWVCSHQQQDANVVASAPQVAAAQ